MKKYLIHIIIGCLLLIAFSSCKTIRSEMALNKGVQEELKGNLAIALSYYTKAINLNPTYAKAYNSAGNIYNRERLFELSVPFLQSAIKLDSTYVMAYANLGIAYTELENYPQAAQVFQKALDLDINSNNICTYNNIGIFYIKQKEYDNAIMFFEKSITKSHIEPNYTNLATALTEKGDYEKAVEHFKTAIRLNPNSYRAYHNLGTAYLKQENNELAIETFRKAITINPYISDAYINLATIYGKQDSILQTIENLEQAIRLNPHNVATSSYQTPYSLDNRTIKKNGQPFISKSSIVYIPVIKPNGKEFAKPYGNLSFYYILTKNYQKSEQSAQKGLSIDSTQTWIKTNLAAALLFQNRYEDAEKVYSELLNTPTEGLSYAEKCLEDLNKYEKADVIPENQKENVEKIRQLLQKAN
ncbi:MAG: tetratricopeptide repeat protein [Prevotellaceae bacterium]|jgi:tetratricopeptide (TPR) repeat protein|nr:tetratricopeptide repeat protein [Prevotellaceae bacterium]